MGKRGGKSGSSGRSGSTSQQPPGGAASDSASQDGDYSQLVLTLLDTLSYPAVANKLNRETIDYQRISVEVSKEVQALVKPLIDSIRKKEEEIKDLKKHCQELAERCDDLEQYSRKNSIRISGIPETENENAFNLVLQVCNDKIKLDPPLLLSEISNCHRVGKRKENGSHRQILVKFMNYQIRKRVFSAKSSLKKHNRDIQRNQNANAGDDENTYPTSSARGEQHDDDEHDDDNDSDTENPMPHPIYINEDLCRGRALLAFKARQIKHSGAINDTWTHDGFIMVKDNHNRIHKISRVAELMKFQ